jgi:hypothetical protein
VISRSIPPSIDCFNVSAYEYGIAEMMEANANKIKKPFMVIIRFTRILELALSV